MKEVYMTFKLCIGFIAYEIYYIMWKIITWNFGFLKLKQIDFKMYSVICFFLCNLQVIKNSLLLTCL